MYKLECKITLNKEITKEVEKAIKEIIDSLNDKLKKEDKEINYKIKSAKEDLSLIIDSKAQTVTDFLVQFDKRVRETLGPKFKMGIKNFEIKSYEIKFELDEPSKKEISIPLVKKLTLKGKEATLLYENVKFDWIKEHYMEKSIRLIKDKIKMLNYEGKDEFRDTVWSGKERKITYNGDPAVDLEEKNWIKRTDAKGQYIYGPEFTALVNVMKELYIENVYDKLDFHEMIFPKFEPWSVPKKSGHAKNVYPNAYFVSVPQKSSVEDWQEVMDIFAITGEVDTDKIKVKSDVVGIMSYAQCPPFWPLLKNRIVKETSLPILVYDWSGPTYRNEAGGTHGLDRVEEFHRVETLFVGTKQQVVKTWKDLKESFTNFYDKVLDLEIRVARVTPWWMAHAGIKTDSGDSDVGTFDIDAYLPYRGDRTKEWLEVQNVSSNGEKYPDAFNVKAKDQSLLWSGCAGTSFERMVAAFLAQKGLETKNWPKEIKTRFEKRIKKIKDLEFY